MNISDQPGRFLAVFLFSPGFILMGTMLKRGTCHVKLFGNILVLFGTCFFIYELFWLTHAAKCAVM